MLWIIPGQIVETKPKVDRRADDAAFWAVWDTRNSSLLPRIHGRSLWKVSVLAADGYALFLVRIDKELPIKVADHEYRWARRRIRPEPRRERL